MAAAEAARGAAVAERATAARDAAQGAMAVRRGTMRMTTASA